MSREAVLLLHGQPGGREDWDGVIGALAGRVRAIAIDRPGWDGSTAATGLAGNAYAAISALDRAGVERAVVVGHSFGGAVACRLAADYPDRVARLLLAAPAANEASVYRLDRVLAAPVLGDVAGAALLGSIGLALAAGPVRNRLTREAGLDSRYLRRAASKLLSPAGWRSFAEEQRTLVRELPQLDRRLSQIAAPTVIVAARHDRVVGLAALERLAEQIPGARLHLLDGGDHLLPLRHANELAELIVGRDPDTLAA